MLVSPYKNTTQFTKVQIKPHMMNSDIQNVMKLVLRKKVEKRCNKFGFIDEVYRIEKFEEEDLKPENLSGCANFYISYHCRLCLPIENSVIIAQVKAINQELILAVNGPIMIFIPKDNVDNNVWDVTDKFLHRREKSNLKTNQFIKIEVINKRINQGDHQIKVIGKLLEFAKEDEIEKFFGSVIIKEEETADVNSNDEDENNFII
jgi:DNA-directed RNA polymerase subunit E'/Rpb7|tara:strand:- start:1112 stop:1726 length:615 start_codon:yes stop_codon:yes gene_type:complete